MRKPRTIHFGLNLFQIILLAAEFSGHIESAIFGEVSQLDIWITSSSLVNKQHSDRSLIFRQIELNWINAPLHDESDYIALYLDSRPRDALLPVSVHRLDGQSSGQIVTDYYLPSIDFYNDTSVEFDGGPLEEPLYRLGNSFDHIADKENIEKRSAQQLLIGRLGDKRRARRALKEECIGYCIAYHSGKRILAENCLKTNPTWMQDSYRYLKSKTLPALMLPGTHNSATYPKKLDETVLHMINKYQQNQDLSIFNQLVYGIRYLDLRVGYSKVKHSPERFWIYHDIFRTEVSVREVLEQVKRFLELTSQEIVIMDFHRFTVGFHNENSNTLRERHATLVDMILGELEHFIVPSYLGYHAPLDEYTSMGRRLLVGYAERDFLLNAHLDLGAKLMLMEDELQDERNNEDNDQQQVEDAVKHDSSQSAEANRVYESSTSLPLDISSYSETRELLETTGIKENDTTKEHSAKIISASSISSRDYIYLPTVVHQESFDEAQHSSSSLSKAALFFPQIRHLWPNKDTLSDLTQYLNDTACRAHFGELKSLMVELTPTVFGLISDKYDGNRKLAQLVNRPVSDMIRDRWLHCVNIVASDYFLGNDLIRLSIHGNKMRATHQDFDFSSSGHCKSFRRIHHLLDTSKIARQFIQLPASTISDRSHDSHLFEGRISSTTDKDTIAHWRSDGSQVTLRLLTSGSNLVSRHRDRRDSSAASSFLDSVSDGFSSLFWSFRKLLNF